MRVRRASTSKSISGGTARRPTLNRPGFHAAVLLAASSPNEKHTQLVMSVYLSGRASALARILRFPVASVHSE